MALGSGSLGLMRTLSHGTRCRRGGAFPQRHESQPCPFEPW
ncbi:hypothetical protein C7S15_5252 [Burkholderia cepacia]|nr:hypothetical protein [Burkholderia cepacia]